MCDLDFHVVVILSFGISCVLPLPVGEGEEILQTTDWFSFQEMFTHSVVLFKVAQLAASGFFDAAFTSSESRTKISSTFEMVSVSARAARISGGKSLASAVASIGHIECLV
mmetsp:Transcript_16024/g.28061  ORF Transcript_16024/g.28061 Transcript_16024/m.28061 type:complete len:111 (-) Transcript_16024:91-423(-)